MVQREESVDKCVSPIGSFERVSSFHRLSSNDGAKISRYHLKTVEVFREFVMIEINFLYEDANSDSNVHSQFRKLSASIQIQGTTKTTRRN